MTPSKAMGEIPQNLRAVLFDLDGTLLDSFPAHFEAYRTAFSRLGRSITKEDFLRAYSPNWYHTYESMGLPRELWDRADAYWLEAAATLKPALFPGVPELLQQCRKRYILGLVTSGSRSKVDRDLVRTGIQNAFSIIITGDDVRSPKPSPEALHRAVEALNVDPGETIYIGDAEADFQMAKAAGIMFVGISSEFSSIQRELPYTPLESIDRISSLLPLESDTRRSR